MLRLVSLTCNRREKMLKVWEIMLGAGGGGLWKHGVCNLNKEEWFQEQRRPTTSVSIVTVVQSSQQWHKSDSGAEKARKL